jgi:hypothetical protein
VKPREAKLAGPYPGRAAVKPALTRADVIGFDAILAIPDIELGDGPIETDSCPFMLVTETCAPVSGSVKLSVENELAERPGVPTGAPAATAAMDEVDVGVAVETEGAAVAIDGVASVAGVAGETDGAADTDGAACAVLTDGAACAVLTDGETEAGEETAVNAPCERACAISALVIDGEAL